MRQGNQNPASFFTLVVRKGIVTGKTICYNYSAKHNLIDYSTPIFYFGKNTGSLSYALSNEIVFGDTSYVFFGVALVLRVTLFSLWRVICVANVRRAFEVSQNLAD